MKNLTITLFTLLLTQSGYAAEVPFQSLAKKLATEALHAASQAGKCVSVAIVDSGGNLAYFEKHDCSNIGGIATAIQKAETANAFRKPTSDFAKSANEGKVGLISAKSLIAVAGGLPIVVDGKYLGGLGVGGATSAEDEIFALAALEKLKN
jgi:glc operon protein GlcG